MDVTGRIARTLIELCENVEAMTHPDGIQINISRIELSSIVGCSREFTGKVLKKLENDGMISVQGMNIVVHDKY
jgi:CRP/FNR family cyclic AMP-dependent transcriptional regulator